MKNGDAFRDQATLALWVVCGLLVVGTIAAGWIGWRVGSWRGLIIGGGAAAALSVAVGFAAALLWAMTQDGG